MTRRRIVDLDRPGRFKAVASGDTGEEGFLLLAGRGSRSVAVALDREQLALLGERLLVIIDELERRGLLAIDAGLTTPDASPPGGRVEREDFRAATLTLAWDEDGDRVILEAYSAEPDGGIGEHAPPPGFVDAGELTADDEPLGPDVLRVRLTPLMAQRFARQAGRLAATP